MKKETRWEKFPRLLRYYIGITFSNCKAWIILSICTFIVGIIIGSFIGAKINTHVQSTKINDYGRHVEYTTYTVNAGDSIWQIATELAPLNQEFKSVRQYARTIMKINHIYDGQIIAGNNIIIPYYVNEDGTLDYDEIYIKYGIGK